MTSFVKTEDIGNVILEFIRSEDFGKIASNMNCTDHRTFLMGALGIAGCVIMARTTKYYVVSEPAEGGGEDA